MEKRYQARLIDSGEFPYQTPENGTRMRMFRGAGVGFYGNAPLGTRLGVFILFKRGGIPKMVTGLKRKAEGEATGED